MHTNKYIVINGILMMRMVIMHIIMTHALMRNDNKKSACFFMYALLAVMASAMIQCLGLFIIIQTCTIIMLIFQDYKEITLLLIDIQ